MLWMLTTGEGQGQGLEQCWWLWLDGQVHPVVRLASAAALFIICCASWHVEGCHHMTLSPGSAGIMTCCWLHLRRPGMYGMPAVADVPQGDSSSSDQGPSAPRRLLRQLSK